jgi:hypothetical protein
MIRLSGVTPPDPEPRRPSAGPWRSHDVTDDDDPDCGSWVVDIPDEGDREITVTRLYFGDMETNTGRDISNADLVAAAPDLLAFVERVETFASNRGHGQIPNWDLIASEARAVIAKATGEARGE